MSHTLYPAFLSLQDGTTYRGWSFFKLSSCFGEIVFNTGMTGYQEIFSDPSYSGQMVVFTYPEIGNVGLNELDNESNFFHLKALIARNISFYSSSWRSQTSLLNYIKNKQIPHIFGIDTRSLTKYLRSFGVTNGVLYYTNNILQLSEYNFKHLNDLDLIGKLTTVRHYTINSKFVKNRCTFSLFDHISLSSSKLLKQYKILIFDLGIKFSIIKKLLLLNCIVNIVPATYSYKSIIKYKPDGILLSNGPGDPILAHHMVNVVKKLIYFAHIPIFGICMGHQILNIAMDRSTFKLRFGHRGLNHPSGFNKYSEMTSQNHGFAVNENSDMTQGFRQNFLVKYLNLNDSTVAATFHEKLPIFSVQYHPESSPGPHDSEYLFYVFIQLINLIEG